MYLTDSKTGEVAAPYKCPKFQKGDEKCVFKCIRWFNKKQPLLDVDGIKFINSMQYECKTHSKLCELSSNKCKLSSNTKCSISSHKIGDFRITQSFLDLVSTHHEKTDDFNVKVNLHLNFVKKIKKKTYKAVKFILIKPWHLFIIIIQVFGLINVKKFVMNIQNYLIQMTFTFY